MCLMRLSAEKALTDGTSPVISRMGAMATCHIPLRLRVRMGTSRRCQSKRLIVNVILLVRKGGLEPPRVSPPDPKSGASANSATLALSSHFRSDMRDLGREAKHHNLNFTRGFRFSSWQDCCHGVEQKGTVIQLRYQMMQPSLELQTFAAYEVKSSHPVESVAFHHQRSFKAN